MADNLDAPVFIINIDTELAWGFISHPHHEVLTRLQSDPKRARETIAWLLELFKKHGIPATWAVVGHLFLDPEEGMKMVSKEMPQFRDGWLDWDFYSRIYNRPLYYGGDLIEKILTSSVSHEIGLHAFFHIPFSQCSAEVAKTEVERGVKAAEKYGITLKSFTFPNNHIGHVDVLRSHGFEIYRSQDAGRHDEAGSFLSRKLNGAVDKLIAPPVLPSWNDGIWELPGSTYFCDPRYPFTLLPRARLGLYRAIRAKRVFHIWLHPWNLLLYDSLKKDLGGFLSLVAKRRNEGKLQVMTMGKLASYLNEKGEKHTNHELKDHVSNR